jgi:uncharacterized damage-inducible protein DinB
MSVSKAAARDLLLYMLWADRTTLRAVREVSAEDLRRDAGTSFGSILGTMTHMLAVQQVWLARFSGQPLEHIVVPDDFPDLIAWIKAWEETASHIEAFLAGLADDQLAAPITWTNNQGETYTQPLWHTVLHLVNHSTYHRGQVVSLLRQMGYQPPSTDLVYYLHQR